MSSFIIAILNKVGPCFCGHALAMLIQSSILILVLLVIDSLLRKRIRAVFRYCIWLLVFVKLLLPPTLSLPTGIGYWCGDYWHANPTSTEVPSLPPVEYTEVLPTGYSVMPSEPMEVQPVEVPVEPPAPAVSVAVPASPSVSLEAGIFLGWFVGILVLAVLLMQRAWFVRGLIAQSKPAEGKLTDILTDCCRELGIRKKIDLSISQNAQSPAACGLLRPKVLLPSSLLARLSSDKLRTVLLHELAHVKRGDLWVNFGQTVLQIIYFYNPLLWLANAMVRRVREQAVDEMVLAHLGDQAGNYSSTLVDIAEIAFTRPALGLRLIGVVESKKALAGRIKHILSKPFPKSAKLGIFGLIVVIALGAVLLPMTRAETPDVSVEVGPEELSAVTDSRSSPAEAQDNADQVKYEGRTIDEWMAQWDSRVSDDIDAATNALIKIGRPAVPRLAEDVKKRTKHGWHAVGVLAKMGPEAEDYIELLIEAALDEDLRFGDVGLSPAAYRATVLHSLSKMTWAKDRVILVLQRIAQDGEEDPDVRASAIWALTNIPKEAIPILAKLTESEERRIRDSARSAIAKVMDKEGQITKSDYYTQLVEKDPFDPSVPQYLWSTKGIINLGHPHPLTQKIKKLYRRRLATEPDPELAWRLATIIQNGLMNTNLEWAAPAGGGRVRSPREDPAESYVTLAEVLELGFGHAQPNSQLWRKFGIALAKLRLLQGDWDRMNATLKNLGQEPIPAESRPWLAAPPDDWQDDLHTKWQVADDSIRSGDCSLEFKIEKDGKGLKGVHFLVKRAPEPTNVTSTGISTDTLFYEPTPMKVTFDSFGYKAQDRPLTRYAISDESGIVRFDRLPDIPVKVEVLIPTSNFPELVSNWDLWMEVEPGKFKIAKLYGGADAVGAGLPPAPEELRQGETVHYPRLVVRPTFRLNIEDWQRIDSDDLVLNWEGLNSLLVDKGLRYELNMSLSAPADPHLSVEHAPVIKSAKLVMKQKQWPVGAEGVDGLRFEAGNIYMFEVRAIDKSGTVVARWPRTRVWVPWGYRQSDPPFTYSYIGPDRPDRQDKPPIYDRVWYRYPREKVIRFIRDYPNAFEHEHARLGKAWLDWHEGDRDGASQQLQRLTKELPKGNVVRNTAIWLLQQMDESERPLKRHRRLNFVPDED